LLDVDNPRAALWKFFEQVSHQPESTLGYVGMGNALSQLAKKDARMLEPALDIYCSGARRLRLDAEIRHVLADFLEANHRALGRCPERNPDEVNVASSQGTRIPIGLRGDSALAYAFRQRLKTVDLMPTEPKYGLALGQSLRRAGDKDGAIAAFDRVLRFSQHLNWQAYGELAATYLAMGRRAEAEETYRRALHALTHLAGQRPFDEEVRAYAALASLQLKDNAEAVRWAREALVREPALQVARFTLACAEWRRGDKVAARAQLAAARMLDNGDDGLKSVDAFLRECVTGIDHLASEGSQ
jgi:tetratricopeptide (TPR) repeat protein